MKIKAARSPFLFGAQYYRAPTPDESCWAKDHEEMEKLGFNSVKYWIQWRWAHRKKNAFIFDDLDRLMDLASKHSLAVTLNIIFDVAPTWLYRECPGSQQVMNSGRVIEPEAVAHRQIGGSPGPCYRHPDAREERERFLKATVNHFKGHPALDMWDIWNEPELCFNQRTPQIQTLTCYCQRCQIDFREWLQGKYRNLDSLNSVWGRCYETWAEVEAPRTTQTITDFVDWREFHIFTLTGEARWRYKVTRDNDPDHLVFLHPVGNFMWCWNSVTCSADERELLEGADIAAYSFNDGPENLGHLLSAARGKILYNTEVHLNYGMTNMHQGLLDLDEVLKRLLPEIGQGVRGFHFWQYRAETLGLESPAWGLVKPDGNDRPVTKAVRDFWKRLQPFSDDIASCAAPATEVGVWNSRKNEIFTFCIHQSLQPLIESINPYLKALYWNNIDYRIVSQDDLANGKLNGLKLLIMPSPYYLCNEEAEQLANWIKKGGHLLSEAHLAGYNGSTGRHSATIPGANLAEKFGFHESDSTSSYRLRLPDASLFEGVMTDDVRKAIQGETGLSGGKTFLIRQLDGSIVWGAERYALIKGEGVTNLGQFGHQQPCLASKNFGSGTIFYSGTNLGQASSRDSNAFSRLLLDRIRLAGVSTFGALEASSKENVHYDLLTSESGRRFLVVQNRSLGSEELIVRGEGVFSGLWSGLRIDLNSPKPLVLPSSFIDLFCELA